jgi:hypothetical protein
MTSTSTRVAVAAASACAVMMLMVALRKVAARPQPVAEGESAERRVKFQYFVDKR